MSVESHSPGLDWASRDASHLTAGIMSRLMLYPSSAGKPPMLRFPRNSFDAAPSSSSNTLLSAKRLAQALSADVVDERDERKLTI
ncbi:hypothetical protein N7490_002048 [Penicillium lividum]|nr:hypothetical protein N7490_002048 [Penicillium lividum]